MGPRLDKLLRLASDPLGSTADRDLASAGRLAAELGEALSRVNGFYAFESALHMRPSGPALGEHSLQEWNADDLWRQAYNDLAEAHLFFAEDIFGGQFSIKDDNVFAFDPETGESSAIASSLEEWADHILIDYEVLTGYPLAHEWQRRNGAIPVGKRLVPRRPFVLGGEFSVDNLYLLDSVESMVFRAEIAVQLRDLPDGALVTFKTIE